MRCVLRRGDGRRFKLPLKAPKGECERAPARNQEREIMAPVLILLAVAGLVALLQWDMTQADKRIRRRRL